MQAATKSLGFPKSLHLQGIKEFRTSKQNFGGYDLDILIFKLFTQKDTSLFLIGALTVVKYRKD